MFDKTRCSTFSALAARGFFSFLIPKSLLQSFSKALSNLAHGLFHPRYFEIGSLESGLMFSS